MSPITDFPPVKITYCPYCKDLLEKLDHTTFYCPNCISQFQIEAKLMTDELVKKVFEE